MDFLEGWGGVRVEAKQKYTTRERCGINGLWKVGVTGVRLAGFWVSIETFCIRSFFYSSGVVMVRSRTMVFQKRDGFLFYSQNLGRKVLAMFKIISIDSTIHDYWPELSNFAEMIGCPFISILNVTLLLLFWTDWILNTKVEVQNKNKMVNLKNMCDKILRLHVA